MRPSKTMPFEIQKWEHVIIPYALVMFVLVVVSLFVGMQLGRRSVLKEQASAVQRPLRAQDVSVSNQAQANVFVRAPEKTASEINLQVKKK